MAKDIAATDPWCPFCGQKVARATDSPERQMYEFPMGECQCGAVYACEATGHNVGAAMVEALLYACDGNSDFAWELLPEDDYLTGRIENYDERTHQVVAKKNIDGRAVRGVLYFVRLHTDVSEIAKKIQQKNKELTDETLQALLKEDRVAIEPLPEKGTVRKKITKRQIRELVGRGDVDGLAALCFGDKKGLRLLQRLLYDPVEENRWYVAWITGRVCARLSSREPGQVSELLHRLFEACSDSAATPWGMVETIGYIVSMRPDIFGAFARHLLNYIHEPSTRTQVLWALAEVSKNRPDLVRNLPFYSLFDFLQHPDGGVRGNCVRLMGNIRAKEVRGRLVELQEDGEEFIYCKDGEPVSMTVAEAALDAVRAVDGGISDER